jgi:DNA repair protein RecN (Recombination protein N)
VLTELRVRNLGVIDDVHLGFGPGMTALTGETGAGKTLLVEALDLVLGGRSSSSLLRAGAGEVQVEAVFGLDDVPRGALADLLADDGADEVILARTVPAAGRSHAWIDGRTVPVAVLLDLGGALVDIHGQHDHQSLLRAEAQRDALDAFAGADRAPLHAARQALSAIDEQLAALGGNPQQRAREADILRHQVAEIEAAHLDDPDEDATLLAEEERLADLEVHREAAQHALAALVGGEGGDGAVGAAGLLREALASFGARNAFTPWEERLRAAVSEVDDLASELRHTAEAWEDDPARLAAVQARRRLLGELRHKYGSTLAEVVAFGIDGRCRLEALEGADADAAALGARRVEAVEARRVAEAALRAVRAEGAPRLAAAVASHLQDLAMPGARVEVSVEAERAGEPVRFLLGANPGETVLPLAKVASGGELARAMLALRLVAEGGPPTMVFDEVDAGVGGAAALALGRALREVARHRQVLVVTHLAQVAAFADHHVAVTKAVQGGRTVAEVAALDGESRTVELSRMLSGHPDSPTARAHAAELLSLAHPSLH